MHKEIKFLTGGFGIWNELEEVVLKRNAGQLSVVKWFEEERRSTSRNAMPRLQGPATVAEYETLKTHSIDYLSAVTKLYIAFFFFFLWPHLWLIEVPRLGVKSELQLQAYITATATPDPSHIFDLLHSLQQHWIDP